MVLNTTLFTNIDEMYMDGLLQSPAYQNPLLLSYENNRITTIGSSFFLTQTSIQNISLPNCSVIPTQCFDRCSSLTNLTLDWREVTSIGNYAFRSCYLLSSLSEMSACTTVGQYAFWSCSALQSINIGATTIQSYAFQGCRNLTDIALSKVNTLQLGAFEECNTLTFIYLPLGNNIHQAAFQNCYSLQMVIMSGTAAGTISANAFQSCSTLLSLYLLGSILRPLANVNAFASTPISTYTTYTDGQRGSIYVPASLYASYIASTNWVTYSARFVSMTDAEIEDFLGGVVTIDVVFNPGDNIVYATDTLDSLKQYLTVTAIYADRRVVLEGTDYTLSGSLSSGISTITVTYDNTDANFDVRVRFSHLPTTYTEVEYILSNGGAYAGDIAIPISSGDQIEAYTVFKYLGSATNNFWVAGDGSTKDGYQLEFGYYGRWYPINTRIDSMDEGSFPNAKYGSLIIRTYTTSVSLSYRICQRSGFGAQSDARRIYDVFFKVNNDMVFELIPCYRNSDNVCGFYDIVTDTFYTNVGAGEFTYEAL